MTIIRNKTGGVASIPSVNAVGIADGGDFDLSAETDGLPAAMPGQVSLDTALRLAIAAGDWVVLDGATELAPADGLLALTPAGMYEFNQKTPAIEIGSVAVVSNVETAVKSWPIPESTRLSLRIQCFAIQAPDTGTTPRAASYSGTVVAGRVGANAPVLAGDTFDGAGNLPGRRMPVSARVNGNNLELTIRVRLTGTLDYRLAYVFDEMSAP